MTGETLAKVLWIGAGGFLGANARFWLGLWIWSRAPSQFPWPTFVINVSGALLLGLLMASLAGDPAHPRAPTLRLLGAVGFLGAYTTFSTFSYETLDLLGKGDWIRALGYSLGSLIAGLSAAWLGVAIGGWLRG